MAKKQSYFEKEMRLYGDALAKAEAKYKRQLKKDPDITPEAFGLSKDLFKLPANADTKMVKEKRRQLEEFTDRKYGLKKIGTTFAGGKETGVYMAKGAYKDALERIEKENRFRSTLSKAIEKAGGYSYARLTGEGIVKEKSNMYNIAIGKSADMTPVRLNIVGGKTVGYKGNQFAKEITLSAESFKAQYGGYSGKATSIHDTRVQQLKDNWLKGLKDKVSTSFANEIEKVLVDLRVDAIDFLGLFHLSSAFDFDFIYDEALTVQAKKEEIRSEIEAFRNDKEAYDAFRREMEKLE